MWPIWIASCAVIGLLVAERRQSPVGVWLTKPLAAACFLWAAWSWGAWDSRYGLLIFCGLSLCWVGDVLLIPKENALLFQAGIGAFLLGHVFYAVAFLTLPLQLFLLVLAVGPLGWFGWKVLRWLGPHLPADFVIPVRVYVAVISIMVLLAVGTGSLTGSVWMICGAICFAVSDLSVARDRFVTPGFPNVVWGLPLYFLAQFQIARSVIEIQI